LLIELLLELIPTGFYENGTVGKDDGRHASVAIVDLHHKFGGLFIPFKAHMQIGDVVSFKKFLCAHAIGAVFSCVHHDLGWAGGVLVGHLKTFSVE
jgi:hypothetical protein